MPFEIKETILRILDCLAKKKDLINVEKQSRFLEIAANEICKKEQSVKELVMSATKVVAEIFRSNPNLPNLESILNK